MKALEVAAALCSAGVWAVGLFYRIGLSNVRPSLLVADPIHQAIRNTSNDSQCMRRHAFCEQPSDIDNLLASQLVCGLPIPSQVNKPSLPLVLRISRKADPFKILVRVIQFVAVNMVDRKARFIPRDKCKPDKPMDKMVNSGAVFRCVNFKIPISRFDFSEFAPLKRRCIYLLFPVTDSCIGSGTRSGFNSAIGADKPANPLRFNFFPVFHDCPFVRCGYVL